MGGRRWTYFASNWANMLWNAQMLLARVSGDAAAAASVRDYLERWREGRVVILDPTPLLKLDCSRAIYHTILYTSDRSHHT